MEQRLLLVEDDKNIGESLSTYLRSENYFVDWRQDPQNITAADANNFDLILLDWMLPGRDGLDLLKEWRKSGATCPILFLTARSELVDKVLGLEMGANDYITKPFEPRELLARIRANTRPRKTSHSNQCQLVGGEIRMDQNTREVSYQGKSIELKKMEYELLRFFLQNPHTVFTRNEILDKVWGLENFPTTRTVDTHILGLRTKFSSAYFATSRGIGYRFSPPKN